jgi:2-phosphoglycerate kinase
MNINVDTSIFQLGQAENWAIFSLIEKEILLSKKLKSQKNPSLIIIGGQPGCGKSTRCADIRGNLTPDNKALFIDMDELREFHPKYQFLNNNSSQKR